MNQKNIALTLHCPDIPILILWGNSCNIFLVIGGVDWTQPFEMLQFLRPSLPLTAFHCVGVSGPLQCAHGPRDVKCFLKALTNSFQKSFWWGVRKSFRVGRWDFQVFRNFSYFHFFWIFGIFVFFLSDLSDFKIFVIFKIFGIFGIFWIFCGFQSFQEFWDFQDFRYFREFLVF